MYVAVQGDVYVDLCVAIKPIWYSKFLHWHILSNTHLNLEFTVAHGGIMDKSNMYLCTYFHKVIIQQIFANLIINTINNNLHALTDNND